MLGDVLAQLVLVAAERTFRNPIALRDAWRTLDDKHPYRDLADYRNKFGVCYLALSQRLHLHLELTT